MGTKMQTINDDFKSKLKEITDLTKKIKNDDRKKIIDMMKDHVYEIEDRYNNKDDHWAIETCDLIVLCYELLISEEKDIDETFSKCLPRFDVKLKKLIEGVK